MRIPCSFKYLLVKNMSWLLKYFLSHNRNQGFVQGIFWTLEILTDDIEEVEKYFDLKSYILDFKKYLVFIKDQHEENVKYLKNIEEHYGFEILDQIM